MYHLVEYRYHEGNRKLFFQIPQTYSLSHLIGSIAVQKTILRVSLKNEIVFQGMDIEEMGPLRMADESFDEEEKEVQSGRPNETPLTKVPNGVGFGHF